MRAIIILFFSLLFIDTSAETHSPDARAILWLNKIRTQESSISQTILHLKAKSYESTQKHKLEQEIAAITIRLSQLQKIIQHETDQKFNHGASDKWLSVLQQARSLQDLNQKYILDLQSKLNH